MKRSSGQPIRVLLAAHGQARRDRLVGLLLASGNFEVAGSADNGKVAIAEARRLRPNVIAMEIDLPILDGYEATRQIMRESPTPIVLISDQGELARPSARALAAGALAVVRRPGVGSGAEDDRVALLTTLRLMADVRVVTRHQARARAEAPSAPGPTGRAVSPKALAIAASTGGPSALQTVLQGLGAGFPLPILVAQHIARGFALALAEWLNSTLALPVQIAQPGERLSAGRIYLAPEDHHLVAREAGVAGLRPMAAGDRFCPSADLLFESVANVYGGGAIGLVLTGMGDDGTRGLLALRALGAATLAQDAASCVVYGMPRAAVEAGAIGRSVPLATIASTILELVV